MRFFVGAILVVCFFECKLAANEGAEAAFQAILKSMSWMDSLKSHDVEISVDYRSESEPDLKVLGENASSVHLRDVFHSSMMRMRSFYDHTTSEFAVVVCKGNSSITLPSEGEPDAEDNSSSYVSIGNKEHAKLFDLEGTQLGLSNNGVGLDPMKIISSLAWNGQSLNQAPVRLLHDRKGRFGVLLDGLIEFLASKPPEDCVVLTSEKDKNRKEIQVIRVKRKFPSKAVAAYRLVVSAEGFDNGLLLELHEGYISPAHRESRYEDESIVEGKQLVSNKLIWKEFEVPRSDEKLVLVDSIEKTGVFKSGQIIKEKELTSFHWTTLRRPDEFFKLEHVQEIARKYRSEIDKRLNR